VGGFRIERLIGSGGMSDVYAARRIDGTFEQKVAIKLMRGVHSDENLLRQFSVERQILANLRHPNIVTLLDGGATEDGTPYVVTELIDGVDLDEYLKTNRLGMEETLQLFDQICAAVEHAHASLVIHRDLKPTNILVQPDGSPKLLDFGIAKILTDDHQRTIVSGLTPSFASPEQLEGLPLSIASDVYSLGAILYLMVTGTYAHDPSGMSVLNLHEKIVNGAVEKPSARVKRESSKYAVPADLDAIILRALSAEPQRRYASVTSLRLDIANLLNRRPVTAQFDTRRYRLRKFVSRHRWGFGASVVSVAALVAALAVSIQQTRIASAQLVRAETVTRFMRDLVVAPSPQFSASYRLGSSATLIELLRAAEDQLIENVTVPWEVRVELFNSIAHSLMWMEEADEAIRVQSHGLALAREQGARNPDVLAQTLANAAEVLENANQLEQALAVYAEADTLTRRLRSTPNMDDLVMLNNYAFTLGRLNRWSEAREVHSRVMPYLMSTEGEDALSNRVTMTKNMAVIQQELGRLDDAERTIRKALELHKFVGSADPYSKYKVLRVLAWILERQGRTRDAMRTYQQAAALEGLTYQFAYVEQAMDRAHAARLQIALGEMEVAGQTIAGVGEIIADILEMPDTWPYHFAHASWLSASGRDREGAEELLRALRLAREFGAKSSEIAALEQARNQGSQGSE
jgi:serine/threonine-protein kinase